MKVSVKNVDGLSFVGKSDTNHWIPMDGPEEHGGFGAGNKPMELVLVALGGCTGMDVVSLLNKMKVKFDDFELEISAERENDYPKKFTKIRILYKFWGDVDEEKVKKAIEKSQNKYCSVSATLRSSANIEYDYEIIKE